MAVEPTVYPGDSGNYKEHENVEIIADSDDESAAERALLPESTNAQPHSLSAAQTGQDASDSTVIAYRPFAGMEKWLQYRFSAWSERKAWFVTLLIVIFFSVGGPGYMLNFVAISLARMVGQTAGGSAAAIAFASQSVLYYFFAVLGLLLALIAGCYYSQPTHISLSPSGIRRFWKRKSLSLAGPLLPWQRVRHIALFRPPGKTSPQDWWLSFDSPAGAQRFRLGAIVTSEERAQLLAAIDRFAPGTTRDPELLEALTPAQDHSYTELWLKALSAPPKRERLAPLKPGATLKDERFNVLGQLGVGGQGTAYLAIDQSAVDNVVLKESILPVYVDLNVRREALERFQREALMLSRLNHNQIVKLCDYFIEDHRSYLVLEHIDGQSLRQLVASTGPLDQETVRGLALQMCAILSYLHGLSPPVVHRDFTPDNLILNSQGILKLVDFNVAQQTELTTTGTVVGKHAYIPPEQFRGKPTTQSDIYALGATLFYLLTAQEPEPISQSHPRLVRSDVSEEMDAIVAKATAIDCSQRFGAVGELEDELSDQKEASPLI
jgi:tRNA A-37 threonylcarbamoyl transferase component Bud32